MKAPSYLPKGGVNQLAGNLLSKKIYKLFYIYIFFSPPFEAIGGGEAPPTLVSEYVDNYSTTNAKRS